MTKDELLKLVFNKENDIFFWQYKACDHLQMPDEELFQMLNDLAAYNYIAFDTYKSEMQYVTNLCMTYRGLAHLYEQGLISDFDYSLRTTYLRRGQHEV